MKRGKITAALLLAAALLNAQKKPKPEAEPAKTYPAERTFATTCDTAWPITIQVLAANGWAIKASDRAGGLLTLEQTRTERLRSHNEFVKKYTTGETKGFWRIYTGFRFGQAQAILTAREGKCSVTFTIGYDVYGSQTAGGPTDWWALPSNGFFEDKMLNEIEAKLPAK